MIILAIISTIINLPGILAGLFLGLFFAIIGKILPIKNLTLYGFNMMISVDQLCNVCWGGDPDETISSRSGKDHHKGYWQSKVLCWLLDKIDSDHCEKAIEYDEGKNRSF